jgi:hypothetical protein
MDNAPIDRRYAVSLLTPDPDGTDDGELTGTKWG